MNQEYFLYPSAIQKLKESGIEERVSQYLQNNHSKIDLESWSSEISEIIDNLASE